MEEGRLLVSRELGLAFRCCLDFCFDIFISLTNVFQAVLFKIAISRKMLIHISNEKKKKCSGPNKLIEHQFNLVFYKFV